MKTLANHLLLYDAECPMCNIYTKAFIKTKMLDPNGREAYQNMPATVCPLVDRQRAVNEIALVNTQTGEVSYGVYSIFKILGNAMPVFRPIFNFRPFSWIMSKVYAFISYNRKIIMPAKAKPNELLPDFKLHYRIAYLILTWLLTAAVLTAYAKTLSPLVPLGTAYREYLICGGQMVFQGLVCLCYKPKKYWDYLGNMMTISFAGALLLLPMLLISNFVPVDATVCALYFLGVAGLMFLEHLRRSHILDLGLTLSLTWAIYRLAVLVWILI
ncbi:DCC1-like thiol-disulfide oxidoreductase family protein [Pedobacter sp. KR3-3]|uniref:DCC1-like thiol-disulfide oxidoreductase family protein n=1 Tax=Pedobacter albus TaxID=3113905 RepID=A0ABU7IC08_9SPHI|nr:DCC1-like thiol-disulfide oxidoreductase family protein [Pedobacter sp. KR3-3]MEE1946826.1 DCC1-like thiol-disulfide oxidoreductase family protein [Pedobacter sp. KR3-3]